MKENKRKQNRIPNYDYSENGYYFVTVCSNARKNMFGEYRIPDIICSLKSRSSVEYFRYIKRNNLDSCGKIWQRSFYDHIIRNERSLNAIREYILDNPVNWKQDIENLLNL